MEVSSRTPVQTRIAHQYDSATTTMISLMEFTLIFAQANICFSTINQSGQNQNAFPHFFGVHHQNNKWFMQLFESMTS